MNGINSPSNSPVNMSSQSAALFNGGTQILKENKRSWICQVYIYDAFADNKPEKYKCRLRLLKSPCGAEEDSLGATVESASYISESGDVMYFSQIDGQPGKANISPSPDDPQMLIPIESLLDLIWQKYDLDEDGCLNNVEIKRLVEDYTSQSVSEEYCQEFLESIDDDGDALIDRMELSKFIEKGINLSKEARESYSQRGEFHKIVVNFFDGVDKVRQDMQVSGGASYNFWGTKLSINCDSIDRFETGHVRVDIMKQITSTKGAKKYKVFNKPFCIPVQILQSNTQYTFSHEFNDENKKISKDFSHKLRFLLSIDEVYYDATMQETRMQQQQQQVENQLPNTITNNNNSNTFIPKQNFDFSSKLHIDSMRIHNKLFETGQICLHVQQVQNVKVDKGDLNTKIFNDTSNINPTNILSQENWENWKLVGKISKPTNANCRPLSYDWITKHCGNTGDKLNIFVSLFHFDPKNGFDESLGYVGTGLIHLFMREASFGPIISEKLILENKLNVDHSTINYDVICTALYKTETLYQNNNNDDSIILPSLSPLKFQNNSLILNGNSDNNNNNNVNNFNQQNQEQKTTSPQLNIQQEQEQQQQPQIVTPRQSPILPSSPVNQEQGQITSPKSPPLPLNALPISPQQPQQQQQIQIPSSPVNNNGTVSPSTSATLSPVMQNQQKSPFYSNINTVQLQQIQGENDRLNNLHQESQNAISDLQGKVSNLEEQMLEADEIISDKSKVIDTLKNTLLRVKRKLKGFNEMERTLKTKETEVVRLNAQMEAMEKTNKELLNRLEQVHKKKFGYAPKKSNNNQTQALQLQQLEQQYNLNMQRRQQQVFMQQQQQQYIQQQIMQQQQQQRYNSNVKNMYQQQPQKRRSHYQHVAYDGKPTLPKNHNSNTNYQNYLQPGVSNNQAAIDRNLQQRQQIQQQFSRTLPIARNDDYNTNGKSLSKTIPYGNSPYVATIQQQDSTRSSVNQTWEQIENMNY